MTMPRIRKLWVIVMLAFCLSAGTGCGSEYFAFLSEALGEAGDGAGDLSDAFEELEDGLEDGDDLDDALDEFFDELD